MDSSTLKQLIYTYIEEWKTGDREKILSTLDPAVVVIESYGPTYRGRGIVGRWIDSWLAPGWLPVDSWLAPGWLPVGSW
ncbi:MAG TPA: hypothetical protein VHZ51_09015 [Ktedonobacteraceae bacterium]|jgi:hypothetical protein|nr:hypothetical protein [Ktedonobacteraceae bacterium]